MKNLAICLLLVLFAPLLFAGDKGAAEEEARAGAADFNNAYETNDLERYFGYYTDDAEAYWYGERIDMKAYYENWKELIASGNGVRKNTVSDAKFQVLAGGKVVVASFFVHNVTHYPDDVVDEGTYFESEVWQKIDGEWKVVHLHFSPIPDAA